MEMLLGPGGDCGPTESMSSPRTPLSVRKKGIKRKRWNDEEVDDDQQSDEIEQTPPDVIRKRDEEWHKIVDNRREKFRRRLDWRFIDSDKLFVHETYRNFNALVDEILISFERMDLTVGDEEDEMPSECLIPKSTLVDLCREAMKLRSIGAMHKVPEDKLKKLLIILEKNVLDVTKAGSQTDNQISGEEIHNQRTLESMDAALTTMAIMTSGSMPKQIYNEDMIDRAVGMTKLQLNRRIYPAFDVRHGSHEKKHEKGGTPHRGVGIKPNDFVRKLYQRLTDLVACFVELVEMQPLSEMIVLNLASLAVEPFFVENVSELQLISLRLAASVFKRYESQRGLILGDILAGVHRLPSAKTPKRTYRIDSEHYISMVSALVMECIQTVVVFPSVSNDPVEPAEIQDAMNRSNKTRKHGVTGKSVSSMALSQADDIVKASYDSAKDLSWKFLGGFLIKCSSKSEEDYRTIFGNFLNDLLAAVNKPVFPAAAMMLSVIGHLLVHHFRSDAADISLRTTCLDYLGTVAARLRKDAIQDTNSDEVKLNEIICLTLGDNNGSWKSSEWQSEEDMDPTMLNLSSSKSTQLAELNQETPRKPKRKSKCFSEEKDGGGHDDGHGSECSLSSPNNGLTCVDSDNDALMFSPDQPPEIVRSPRNKSIPSSTGKNRNRKKKKEDNVEGKAERTEKTNKQTEYQSTEKGSNKDCTRILQQALVDYLLEKRPAQFIKENSSSFYIAQWYTDVMSESGDEEKISSDRKQVDARQFLLSLVDRDSDISSDSKQLLSESQAAFVVKYLASRRKFGLDVSFDQYLRHLLCVLHESQIGLRTKAIRSLTLVIESDPNLLARKDVHNGVYQRLADRSASVREAALDLIGKFMIARPDLFDKYHDMVSGRILDVGLAVRKRAIKIMAEFCQYDQQYPLFFQPRFPEICLKIIRRVNDDEESIKRLVNDTFQCLWFNHVPENENNLCVKKKVIGMVKVVGLTLSSSLGGKELIEILFSNILKAPKTNRIAVFVAQQIVDILVREFCASEALPNGDSSNNIFSASDLQLDGRSTAQGVTQNFQAFPVSCWTCLHLLCKVCPKLMAKHTEVLISHLSMECKTQSDMQITTLAINILENSIPEMDHPSEQFLCKVEEALQRLIKTGSSCVVQAAIPAMSAVIHGLKRNMTPAWECLLRFYNSLNRFKHEVESDQSGQRNDWKQPVALRSIFVVGLLCRYFDFDKDDVKNEEGRSDLKNSEHGGDREKNSWARVMFDLFMSFAFTHKDTEIRKRALVSLGDFCAFHSDYLMDEELKNHYLVALKSERIDPVFKAELERSLKAQAPKPDQLGEDLKQFERTCVQDSLQYFRSCFDRPVYCEVWKQTYQVQVLKNLEKFLLEEENKMAKLTENWNKTKNNEALKDMNDSQSGFGAGIMQLYLNQVMLSYFHPTTEVRLAATSVLSITIGQGLVTPANTVSTLICMTTDPDCQIRTMAERTLKDTVKKYPDVLYASAIQGVRHSFRLHQQIKFARDEEIRRLQPKSRNAMNKQYKINAEDEGIRGICQPNPAASFVGSSVNDSSMTNESSDVSARLGFLYDLLRKNRQQRRTFLAAMLKQFESVDDFTLDELIYLADNLSAFPYQNLEEPLFLIYEAEKVISIAGYNFQEVSKDLTEDVDAVNLLATMDNNSGPAFLLYYLKNHIKQLYNIKDEELQNYFPSDSSFHETLTPTKRRNQNQSSESSSKRNDVKVRKRQPSDWSHVDWMKREEVFKSAINEIQLTILSSE